MLYFWKNDKPLRFDSLLPAAMCFLLLMGCTKDDICSENTQTTPLLVVEFRDIIDRTTAKAVQDLQILVNNADSIVVAESVSDTLVRIPLNTEADISSFILTYNNSNEALLNSDYVSFNYDREEVYVNRACSFKMNYRNLLIVVDEEVDGENWILDTEVNIPTVENENDAHITIYH